MISIKELSEVPLLRVLFIAASISFSIMPPLLWVYTIDKELFLSLDFLKLFFLASGFGIMATLFSILLMIFGHLIIDEIFNYKMEDAERTAVAALKGLMVVIGANIMVWVEVNGQIIRKGIVFNSFDSIIPMYWQYLLFVSIAILVARIFMVKHFKRIETKQKGSNIGKTKK